MLIGLSIGILVFCGTSWYYLDLLYDTHAPIPKSQPAKEDIVGTWYIDNSSRSMLEESGYIMTDDLEYKFEINGNGQINAINVPDQHGHFFSDTGTWKLQKIGKEWRIIVYYRNGYYTNYNVSGENPPYTMYEIWGELTALGFERKK